MQLGVLEGKEQEDGRGKVFEETMAENVLSLVENIILQKFSDPKWDKFK